MLNVWLRIYNIRCIMFEVIFKERVCLSVLMLILKELFGVFYVNFVIK